MLFTTHLETNLIGGSCMRSCMLSYIELQLAHDELQCQVTQKNFCSAHVAKINYQDDGVLFRTPFGLPLWPPFDPIPGTNFHIILLFDL